MIGEGSQIEGLLNKYDGRVISPYKTKFRDLAVLVFDIKAKKEGAADKLADLLLSIRLSDASRDDLEFAFLAANIYLGLTEGGGRKRSRSFDVRMK